MLKVNLQATHSPEEVLTMRTQPKNRLVSLFRPGTRLHGPSFRGLSLRGLLVAGLLLTWAVLGAGALASDLPRAERLGESLGDPPTLIKHLRTELHSKDPVRRDLALVDIAGLGRCTASCSVTLLSVPGKNVSIANDTELGTVVDLEVLVPDLIRVYQRDPVDGHRLLALAALIYIGNQAALEKLIAEIPSQSPDVQQRTTRTLVGYYLEKYPELREETERTRVLEIEDVERAERLRLQVAQAEEAQN
jgi:hypothetical protein